METVRQTQKKYGSRAMVAAIVIGLLLMVTGHQPEGKGLILGCFFSIVNFVLIGETLPLKMNRSRRGATMASLVSIFFRFFLMAVPLVVAIKLDRFNVFAVIPGLLMVQFAILTDHFSKALAPGSSKRAKGKV